MSADTAPLSKVDSAVSGLGTSPPNDAVKGHRRASSSATGVYNIADLEKEGKDLVIAKETQKLNWKLNTSPASLDEKDTLKKLLTNPPVKKIDLHFPLGLEVTARNLKGVTIKDALDAIYKQFKKKASAHQTQTRLKNKDNDVDSRARRRLPREKDADDELEDPILAGFEWDKEESWTRLKVHQKKEGAPAPKGKKGKKGQDQDD
ncbi:MAG: RNA recognition motif-containing protein [Chaenotheca gracillima]|nr:MAG: RNA recognition motif-containing protein [Chaenotheca gracillima]